MSDEIIEPKSQGKATEVKLRDDFQPTSSEIKAAQDLARSISPFALDLFEAEEYQLPEE